MYVYVQCNVVDIHFSKVGVGTSSVKIGKQQKRVAIVQEGFSFKWIVTTLEVEKVVLYSPQILIFALIRNHFQSATDALSHHTILLPIYKPCSPHSIHSMACTMRRR